MKTKKQWSKSQRRRWRKAQQVLRAVQPIIRAVQPIITSTWDPYAGKLTAFQPILKDTFDTVDSMILKDLFGTAQDTSATARGSGVTEREKEEKDE